MALTITDPRLIKLIEQRARERGTSVEQTIADALVPAPAETLGTLEPAADVRDDDDELEELSPLVMQFFERFPDQGPIRRTKREARELRAHVDRLIDEIREGMDLSLTREDYDEMYYDEDGLPK